MTARAVAWVGEGALAALQIVKEGSIYATTEKEIENDVPLYRRPTVTEAAAREGFYAWLQEQKDWTVEDVWLAALRWIEGAGK